MRTAHATLASNNFFIDGQAKKEVYATSWVSDLLSAWKVSKDAQGLTTAKLRINGLTDPTRLLNEQHGAGGHSVGMSVDLGVLGQFISPDFQQDPDNQGIIAPITSINGWSLQNAIAGAGDLTNLRNNNQRDALLNFLSLYAVTQSGTANGTWSDLPIVNGNRTALFGSGGQNATQLIQNVWIGGEGVKQNPYVGINYVLDQLGFSANGLHHGTEVAHHNHFHIDLRAPQRVGLPENLSADNSAANQATPVADDALIAHAQSLLDQFKTDLNLTQGEVIMFIPDMPNVPPQNVPVMIAQANQAQAGNMTTMRSLGVCSLIPNAANANYSGENVITPEQAAKAYFRLFEPQKIAVDTATITILQHPNTVYCAWLLKPIILE